MRLNPVYKDRKARIELVPLIDIMFLTMVSFVYAMLSMDVYNGLKVDLPAGSGMKDDQHSIIITISSDNTLSMGDVTLTSLNEAVSKVVEDFRRKNRPVLVMGDKNANLGVAVELLSGLKNEGILEVSFQVKDRQ